MLCGAQIILFMDNAHITPWCVNNPIQKEEDTKPLQNLFVTAIYLV